ncbi:MAG: acetyl-CoA synthase subunit gamma [Deltaproteobacteria bacterium]|nr:acetyl-CoA synthase subunit gamma [Deltaproteobacteria bacterium]
MSDQDFSGIPLNMLPSGPAEPLPPWITGVVQTSVGSVSRIATTWDRNDRRGEIKARISDRARMAYTIKPGLLAVGNPTAESPVLLSANYKLSFDILRRELAGIDAWILVLDTQGINVWCAAGKGTFGTDEIIRRVRDAGLEKLVSHHKIISPQLGAPGIKSHLVKKATGFRVKFGPVEARDIRYYLENGEKVTPAMRQVTFDIKARTVLVPFELSIVMKKSWLVLLGIPVFFGLMPQGILFHQAFSIGLPVLMLFLAAVLTGAALTPILLPWIPFPSFTIKGFLLGLLPVGMVHYLTGIYATPFDSLYLLGASYLAFPALSGYLAFNFTGCSTFTSPSGVTKELRILLKVYAVLLPVVVVLLICYKLQIWGIL